MAETARDPKTLRIFEVIETFEAEWFGRFRDQVLSGLPYVLSTLVFPHEIFEALGILWLEDLSLVRPPKPMRHYEELMAARGHIGVGGIPGFGGGLAAGGLSLALALDEARSDTWCGLPRPAAVITSAADRSAQIMAEHLGIPCIILEMPCVRRLNPNWWEMSRWQWEELDEPDRIEMFYSQLESVVSLCEQIAGRNLDRTYLAEIVAKVNAQEHYYDEIRALICAAPKMPFRMREVERVCMCIQRNRGSDWALAAARTFRDEVVQRIADENWICPNEAVRLMWNGSYTRFHADVWDEFEQSHGVVFARALWLSIGPDGYLREGARDPLRALASRYTTMHLQAHQPPFSWAWNVHEAQRHRIDGVLHQVAWEWYSFMPAKLEAAGIPVLKCHAYAESWDKDDMRATIREFLEKRVLPSIQGRGSGRKRTPRQVSDPWVASNSK